MSTELVAELCEQGLAAEGVGRLEHARDLYTRAWDTADDAFSRCLAANYRTRLVETPDERLTWARTSVEYGALCAESDDARIYPLLPTLHITVAAALYEVGQHDSARDQYLAAARALQVLSDATPQAALLQGVVFEGLKATGYTPPGTCHAVERFIDTLERDMALGPLAFVLSAYVNGCGTDDHGPEFVQALRELRDAGVLSESQQRLLGEAVDAAQQLVVEGNPVATEATESTSTTPSSTAAAASVNDHNPFGDGSPNVALRI